MTFNVVEPLTLILLLTISVLLIFLGKEIKRSFVPAIGLVGFLLITILHTVQLVIGAEGEFRSLLFSCLTFDLVMVFLLFISYLWVDDIACKEYKKKSIDNSLDWFWKKI